MKTWYLRLILVGVDRKLTTTTLAFCVMEGGGGGDSSAPPPPLFETAFKGHYSYHWL